MTMNLNATFLEKAPAKISEGGMPVSHVDSKIHFRLVGGWAGGGEQLNDSTVRIKFSNFGVYRRADNLIVLAYNEGDKNHSYTEQVGQIKYPIKNKEGKSQSITFPKISNIKSSIKRVVLNAKSDIGLPVEYYVKYGPVHVDGNIMTIQQIPVRTKYPVEVCIGAYQWGRSIEPKIQSAEPVEVVFYINK
jgi:hypothetical protein